MIPENYPEHSPLSISAGEIWGPSGNCTGYPQMAAYFPDDETEASREGTAAHELFPPMIEAAGRAGIDAPKPEDYIGRAASNGVIWTEEMWQGADLFAAEVATIMRRTGVFGGDNLGIERRVHAPEIHVLFYGRCDVFLWDARNGVLYVWDYKFGFSRVNVYRNMQLIGYALCVLHMLGLFDGRDEHITVEMAVVQPRSYHPDGPVQTWRCKASDLRAIANQYANNAEEALGPNAVCRSGPHCSNCRARIGCLAFLEYTSRLFRASSQPVPQQLTNAQIGLQLQIVGEAAEMLRKLYEGYEAAAEAKIRSGQDIPGAIAEPRYGHRIWNQPDEQVINIGRMISVELEAPRKAKTPAQAKAAGMDPDLIQGLSTVPNQGVKISLDNRSQAKKVFEK